MKRVLLLGCAVVSGLSGCGRTDLSLLPDDPASVDATPGSTSPGDAAVDAIVIHDGDPDDATMNEAGLDAGPDVADATLDAPDENAPPDSAPPDASVPPCAPGSIECQGGGVATCEANGHWGDPTACSGATPFCANGACSALPPSCLPTGPGMSNCGAASESCCTSPVVAGGDAGFFRTYTTSGGQAFNEAHPATVSSLRLDKYQVTVGRFRQFVQAWNNGAWLPAPGSGKHTHLNGGNGLKATSGGYEPGWVASDDGYVAPTDANLAFCSNLPDSTWTPTAGAQENLPINCLTWQEEYAFCIWDGGFLASETEWEYAAAGGDQLRQYPWGTTDPGTASQYAIYGCYYPNGSGTCDNDLDDIAPVGTSTLGAGRWGQLDLGGNMWEFALDWYAANYVDPCVDCADMTQSNGDHAIKGSWWYDPAADLRPTFRSETPPQLRASSSSFRCARTPD